MRSYIQLTQNEPDQIYALCKANYNPTEISRILGLHKTVIYRQLKRNQGKRGYCPAQDHRFAAQRHGNHIQRRIQSWKQVESLIRQDWSPEQISLWLSKEGKTKASHQWICQYILKDQFEGGELDTHLRGRKKRKKRYGTHNDRGRIPNRVSIDQRPAVVETRSRIGDGEVTTTMVHWFLWQNASPGFP